MSKVELLFIPCKKINNKLIRNLNVRAKIIKFLEKTREIFIIWNMVMISGIWHQNIGNRKKNLNS